MKKAVFAYIAIVIQSIICMVVNYFLGYGYALVLLLGFFFASFAFSVISLREFLK